MEFVLFGLMLAGVATFHRHTLQVSLVGLAAIAAYKLAFTGFNTGQGFAGLGVHFTHEWVILTNLFALLTGFAVVAHHFEESHVPSVLPRFLPDGWRGGFALLAIVFVLSSFLDNIAGAIIGGTIASALFRDKVHIGFLAAIVAAANAGGTGSVIGDTTTTMMWLAGVPAFEVFPAYVAALVALLVCAIPASLQQQRYAPIDRAMPADGARIDGMRVGIVAVILAFAIGANVVTNLGAPEMGDGFPVVGVALWAAIIATVPLRRPDWSIMPEVLKGSVFLIALVASASMMPIEQLPAPSWQTTFGLGFVSSVFDNVPLTALALKQGGYDWAMLAYAVGYGGSMIWFGSTAGVVLSSKFSEAKSVHRWLTQGWHVTAGYIAGFFVMLALVGWHPGKTATNLSTGDTTVIAAAARAPA